MHLLFVEDNDLNRRVVRHMLETAGIEMAEASRAETGLSMIAANDYDLVLMDLRMPGMDGLAAIRRIRARRDAKASTPVIVVTADTAADIREQCISAGADEVLHKPLAMETLFDAIARTVHRSAPGGVMLG